MEKETIYIDPVSFHAQRKADNALISHKTAFFVGKCDALVEGYIVVPPGYEITIENIVHKGELITMWKPLTELESAQRDYERQQLADYKAACERMGIKV